MKEQYPDDDLDRGGEDEDFVLYDTIEQKIEAEIVKIGQPWNQAINILDPDADEKIKKQGADAARLRELRIALSKIKNQK